MSFLAFSPKASYRKSIKIAASCGSKKVVFGTTFQLENVPKKPKKKGTKMEKEQKNLLPVVLEDIPSKLEISTLVDMYGGVDKPELNKYLTIKALETFCKEYLEGHKVSAKKDFLATFGGATKMNVYGVEVKLRSRAKQNTMAENWHFSKEVTDKEAQLEDLKLQVDTLTDVITALKYMEINNGTATKVEGLFDEVEKLEEDPSKDFSLIVTLRKD